MRIALIGGRGMLGTDLVREGRRSGAEMSVFDMPEVNIADPACRWDLIPPCDAVVNCAAFTRVDDAEKEKDAARAVNAIGARNVADFCASRGVRLLHVSTDYVFDGTKGSPYVESDEARPLNHYGTTKLEGERAVASSRAAALIVRTQSLYGVAGRNFVKAILSQVLQGRKTLRVVSDQVSSPTYTAHLAEGLLRLLRTDRAGIVHVAARGSCSWFDFARAIVRAVGAGDVEVLPSASADLNLPARRPAFSVLDTSRLAAWTGWSMPPWEQGLEDYLREEPLVAQVRAGRTQ